MVLAVIGMVVFCRRMMRLICLVSYLMMGGAVLSAFNSSECMGHWPYLLCEKMKFVYVIGYKFGGFVYVAGGDVFDIEELS